MNKKQALALADSKFWEEMSPREIAIFQLFENLLCMPFTIYHEAIEKALGRPVYTHEFGFNVEGLKAELLGGKKAPTLDEIIELIPKEKQILVMIKK